MAEITTLKYHHVEMVIKIESFGPETVDLALDTDLIDTDRDRLVGEDQQVSIKSVLWNTPYDIELSRYESGASPEKIAVYNFTGNGNMKLDSINTVGVTDTVGASRDIRVVFSGGNGGAIFLRLGKIKGYEANYNPAVDGYDAIEPS